MSECDQSDAGKHDVLELLVRLANAERERDEAVALLDEAEQWLGDNDDEEATARRIRAFLAKLEERK